MGTGVEGVGRLVVGRAPADPFIEGDFDVVAGGGFGGTAGLATVAAGGELDGVGLVGRVVGIEKEQGTERLDLFENGGRAARDSPIVGPFHLDDISAEQQSLGSLSHNYLYRWRRGSS